MATVDINGIMRVAGVYCLLFSSMSCTIAKHSDNVLRIISVQSRTSLCRTAYKIRSSVIGYKTEDHEILNAMSRKENELSRTVTCRLKQRGISLILSYLLLKYINTTIVMCWYFWVI